MGGKRPEDPVLRHTLIREQAQTIEVLELRFSHDYDITVPRRLRNSRLPVMEFTGEATYSKKKPLAFEIIPHDSDAWLGLFTRYGDDSDAVTGVFTTPARNRVCIVSFGQGYIVRVDEPYEWEVIRTVPITAVRDIPSLSLMIFADFTHVSAYGSDGFEWETARLAYDGIRLTRVTEEAIEGMAWSAPLESAALSDSVRSHSKKGDLLAVAIPSNCRRVSELFACMP